MNLSLSAYQSFLRGIVSILECFPPKRVDVEEVTLRKGHCEYFPGEGEPCIWVHGASLGEVITLRPLLRQLADRFGRERVLATATTMDGLKRLRSDAIAGRFSLLPLEIPEYLDPFLDRMKPALVLISETEIWPLLLNRLRERHIPYGTVNGRINPKSVKLIHLLWPLFSEALEGFSFVFPQTSVYRKRFSAIGIGERKIQVLGGFKFDANEPAPNRDELLDRYAIPDGRTILCFGSTHPGEERMILEALAPLWESMHATVILAPRHLKRINEVEMLLDEFRIEFSRLSQKKRQVGHVLLIDTLGDLKNLYSLSHLGFVGGSLVPHGGHNLMEPAVYGVPLVTGPHQANFALEMSLLENNQAVFKVVDASSLQRLLQDFLDDPRPFREAGTRAHDVLTSMSGAVSRTMHALDEMGLMPAWKRMS